MAYVSENIFISKSMEPIQVATELVTAEKCDDDNNETGVKVFTPGQLREIAEYLVVYANQAAERKVKNG